MSEARILELEAELERVTRERDESHRAIKEAHEALIEGALAFEDRQTVPAGIRRLIDRGNDWAEELIATRRRLGKVESDLAEAEATTERATRARAHDEDRADRLGQLYGEAAVERDRLRVALVVVTLVYLAGIAFVALMAVRQ